MQKKIYKAPELKKLKSINKMTQAVDNQGASDGGQGWAHSS
ncbi:hypothetical protein [Sulfurovum sp.]